MKCRLTGYVAALLVFATATGTAATYFVDYASGSDANEGTDASSPWKHCPGDSAATGSALTALKAGDIIKFKNDVIYVGTIVLNWGGTAGNNITYDGASWGGGKRAIVTNNNSATSVQGFTEGGDKRDYITITGFNFKNIGGYAEDDPVWTATIPIASVDTTTDVVTTTSPHGMTVGKWVSFATSGGTLPTGAGTTRSCRVQTVPSATTLTIQTDDSSSDPVFDFVDNGGGWWFVKNIDSPPGGYGIKLSDRGNSNMTITNCKFEEIGQWQNTKPLRGTGSITGTGVSLANNRNVTISGCEFTRMKTGVSIKGTVNNITVSGSNFHNYMNWLIDVAPAASGSVLSNVTIDDCDFHDYKEFDEPNFTGYGEKPHQDGIFFRTSAITSTWTNIVVKNSRWWSDTSSNGGTASIFISQGPSVDIYNCLFLSDKHANANVNIGYRKAGVTSQRVRVWNCTFRGSSVGLRVSEGNSNPDEVEVLNCIFDRTYAGGHIVEINRSEIGNLTMNNNVYSGSTTKTVYDGTYRSLASWQSVSGQDEKSIQGDPRFARVDGPPSGWDMALKADSPARFRGANLSRHFRTDKAGVSRPEGDIPWMAGAYHAPPRSPNEPLVVERP